MNWLKSTGQFFLHELMHTRLAYGSNPNITDEYTSSEGNPPKAYGPKNVNKLARLPKSQGGGVTTGSTNADSYAMLANCMYWWKTTRFFPAFPGAKDVPESSNEADPPDVVMLSVDLDNSTNPDTANFAELFNIDLKTFGDNDSS